MGDHFVGFYVGNSHGAGDRLAVWRDRHGLDVFDIGKIGQRAGSIHGAGLDNRLRSRLA